MNVELNQQLREWLSRPREEQNIEEGALIMLKYNRARVLYQNIVRRPNHFYDKLVYELQKALRRVEEEEEHEANVKELHQAMDLATAVFTADLPAVENGEEAPKGTFKGLREDHDSLPEAIKHLYVENGEIFYRMKQLYEQLRKMEDNTDSERKPLVVELLSLEDKYAANWERYDHYDPADEVPEAKAEDAPAPAAAPAGPMPTVAEVNAARKYVSENREKLALLMEEGDEEKIVALRDEMQNRIDIVLQSGGGFKEEHRQKLADLGLLF